MNSFRMAVIISHCIVIISLFSGCFDDSFLDAIKEEEDFVAPYDVVLTDTEKTRTVYFNISDTGYATSLRDGDDGSYTNIPKAKSYTERLNANSTTGDVVDDTVTGLTWTKCTADGLKSMKSADDCSGSSNIEMSWNDAYTTCDSLSYAGYDDWRLPSLSELFTLLSFAGSPFIDTAVFPDTSVVQLTSPAIHEPAYWTSTSRIFLRSDSYDVTDYSWVVYFNMGPYTIFGKFQITNFVEKMHYDSASGSITPAMEFTRCVRGGSK